MNFRSLRNQMVHYGVYKSPPPVHISQIFSVHSFLPYLLKIRFNIIVPSGPESSNWSLLFNFFNQNSFHTHFSSTICVCVCVYVCVCVCVCVRARARATCPAHLIFLDFIILPIPGEEHKYEDALQPYHFLQSIAISPLLSANILNTLFSKTLNSWNCLRVKSKVPHTKATDTVIILCLLIPMFIHGIWNVVMYSN
jgi:hypothetical protein